VDDTEELDLVAIIRVAPDSPDAAAAREGLHRAHRPFIRKVAKGHCRGRGRQNLPDLIQAGAEGYFAALSHFDPTRGVRVWSYVKHEVEGAMGDAAAELGNRAGFKLPEKNGRSALVRMREALERLAADGNDNPTKDEIAAEMGVDPWKVDLLVQATAQVASLDTFELPRRSDDPDDDGPAGLHETVATEQRPADWSVPWPPAEEGVDQAEARGQVEQLLHILDARQRDVVVLYYGLNGRAMSATEIGKRLDVRRITKQAVQKIVKAALAEMRAEAEARGWAPERKPRLTPSEDATRAFMRRRVETVRRHRRFDEFDAENHIYSKGR
jgi:RNA polymerase sigma factor (sigma-70 family)